MRAAGLLRRVAAMPATELRDRLASTVRREAARLAHRARPAAWRREDLAAALVPRTADVAAAIAHLSGGRAGDAHDALAASLRHPAAALADRAGDARGGGPDDPRSLPRRRRRRGAASRGIAGGRFDLLGYRDLRFDAAPGTTAAGSGIDWHRDPVHDRVAPALFWSEVPYLDPACGDHKIIWELNRHQHFLALGRAWWLAGAWPARDAFVAHLAGWMDANPPLVGINWASMLELALRSLSWIWALEFFAEPPARPDLSDGRAAVDGRPAARPRSPAAARRAEPVDLLQPEHPPAGRGPRAVRRRPHAAGAAPARRVGGARAPHPDRGDAAPDQPRRRPRRAIVPLPPLHARLLSAGAGGGATHR